MASGTRAGLKLQAFDELLPAATATVTPSATTACTAASSAADAGPPRLKLATAGTPAAWSAITQLSPAMTADVEVLPEQSKTLTGTRSTDLATPYVVPPIVPATCV